MELAVAGGQNVEVADKAFAAPYNETLIHQVVTAYLAGARSGTRAQKTRGQVRGGGAKPWRQKGTGRARAGSIRSPIWRGGGVTFAARPNNYEQKVNRKAYRAAMRSIISELVRSERLLVVDAVTVDEPKTKKLLSRLAELGLEQNLLIVTGEFDMNLALAARNLPSVAVFAVEDIDPVSLIGCENVLVDTAALRAIEERLA